MHARLVALRRQELESSLVREECVLFVIENLGRPEVCNFHVVQTIDEYILRLYIKMDYFFTVNIG
jgi:hypothetical protein